MKHPEICSSVGTNISQQILEQSVDGKDKPKEDINNALEIILELNALNLILERQSSGDLSEVRAVILHQDRLSNFDPKLLQVAPGSQSLKFVS